MLTNLLPGLRDLRAPLASGYLWLISLWMVLSNVGWLPDQQPSGRGEIAQFWALGGALGKTVVLAALTFTAYLIGSFLEIKPDGRVARTLTQLSSRRSDPNRELYDYLRDLVREHQLELKDFRLDNQDWSWSRAFYVARFVSHSLSREAHSDLLRLLERRNVKNRDTYTSLAASLLRLSGRDASPRVAVPPVWLAAANASEKQERIKSFYMSRERNNIAFQIIQGMPQLAIKLQVKNRDLYAEYGKFMAEAALRMNISIPLAAVLILALLFSGLPIYVQILLMIIVVIFASVLFRQGILRAISARDLIVQALAADELESNLIPAKKPVPPAEEMNPSDDVDQQIRPGDQLGDNSQARVETSADADERA